MTNNRWTAVSFWLWLGMSVVIVARMAATGRVAVLAAGLLIVASMNAGFWLERLLNTEGRMAVLTALIIVSVALAVWLAFHVADPMYPWLAAVMAANAGKNLFHLLSPESDQTAT